MRKALLARGWDLAWIDGVTGEIMKRKLTASVSDIEAAVSPPPLDPFLPWAACPPSSRPKLAASHRGRLYSWPSMQPTCTPSRPGLLTSRGPARPPPPLHVMLSFALSCPLSECASVLHRSAMQISYLEGLGIPTKSVENMASINKQARTGGDGMWAPPRCLQRPQRPADPPVPWIPPLLLTLSVAAVQVCIPLLPAPNPKNTPWPGLQILGQPVAALQAVVDYVQRQGVTGKSCRAEGRGLALTPVHEGDKRAEVECGQARLGSIEWFQVL